MVKLYKSDRINLLYDIRNVILIGVSFSSDKNEFLITALGFTCFVKR